MAPFGALTTRGQGFFSPVIFHLEVGLSSSTLYADLKGPEEETPSVWGVLWLLDIHARDRST